MEHVILTRSQARNIILHAAGLARKGQFGTGPEAVYRVIDQLGFVQLDTNYVVERAHHHVMASRIPDYQKEWLSDLCEDGRVFEYFASDAGFLPMTDFRFSLPVKESFKANGKPLTIAETRLTRDILDRIEREGSVMVGDFEYDRPEASTGWWDWRPAKVALERLYLEGKLMVTRNKKFHKVYDLPLNLLPVETEVTMPAPDEFAQYVIRRTLGALGIAYAKEIAWRARRVKGHVVKKELDRMVTAGEIREVVIEGLTHGPLYILRDQPAQVDLKGDAFILSPFDILNVFRHRLKDFFDFDYQIECFVPAAKRKYGYFSLPVLVGNTFVARMDVKADRKNKILLVHNLHFEDIEISAAMFDKIAEALKAFVHFNQCRDINFKASNHPGYLKTISQRFS